MTDGEKTQYTTRISNKLLEQVRKIASDTGASTNSTLSILVSLGLKVYDGKVTTHVE